MNYFRAISKNLNKYLKVGIAGAGRMGKKHLLRLQKIEDVKVVSICDTTIEKAEKLATGLEINTYSDLSRMIDKEVLDAVWICTPADTHSNGVSLCLEKNIPFFLEKPVTINLKEGEKMLKKIKKKKILHSVGYQLRYLQIVEKLKEILANEKLALVSAQLFWTIPLVDSIKSKEKAGGQVVDQATHFVDLMRYLVGEVEDVYSRRVRGLFPEEKLYTADDASATVFKFKNGVVGNLVCTYALFPEITKDYPFKMLFICKKKLIEFTDNKLRIITSNGSEMIDSTEDACLLEDQIFIQAIKVKKQSIIKSDYADAFQTTKVCLLANESMEKGLKIKLV